MSGHSSFFCDKGHNTTNTQSESGFGDIDTMRILNDIFGMCKIVGMTCFIKRVIWMKKTMVS